MGYIHQSYNAITSAHSSLCAEVRSHMPYIKTLNPKIHVFFVVSFSFAREVIVYVVHQGQKNIVELRAITNIYLFSFVFYDVHFSHFLKIQKKAMESNPRFKDPATSMIWVS